MNNISVNHGGQRVNGKPATERDTELFQNIETNLYTAVIADGLDELGYHNQAMREYLRPLSPDFKFAGWARTILCVDVFYAPPDPYEMEIEAMDSILPGEVVAVSTGESKRNAPWGELLSTAAHARGARGAPFLNDKQEIIAALSVVGRTSQIYAENCSTLAEWVIATARSISDHLKTLDAGTHDSHSPATPRDGVISLTSPGFYVDRAS